MSTLADIGFPSVWDDYLLAAAAVVVAWSAIWVHVLRPIVRAAARAGDVADTLYEIAQEFKPDHGTSLKDVLTSLESEVSKATAVVEDIRSMNQRLGEVEQHLGITSDA